MRVHKRTDSRGGSHAPEAPSTTGGADDRPATCSTASRTPSPELRIADALAIYTWGACETWTIHGFECKTNRKDWLRELEQPEKCGPHKLFCSAWWLVVPAPWKHVVLSLDELPQGWGLIEVGTGDPFTVHEATHREAEPPTVSFLHAVCRAASTAQAEADAGVDVPDVPLVPIRRRLGRGRVVCIRGHVIDHAPMAKAPGRVECVPCAACAEELPSDVEASLYAIEDASAEDLDAIERAVQRRRALIARTV